MKILAFAASNSSQSINKQLVRHAAEVMKTEIAPDCTIETIDLNDFEMPIYSIDRETESGIPDHAHAFFKQIGDADSVMISFAEHNGNFTAAFKNIFDWASRIDQKVFQGKPMVMLSTSVGKGGAANVLRIATTSAPHFGGEVRASLSIGPFHEKFNTQDGTLSDAELAAQLRETLRALL